MKKIPALIMIPVLAMSLCSCEKKELQEAARPVSEAITNIGEVTLEDEQAIANAQSMYDSLPEEAKAYVENYEEIKKAKQKIYEIKGNSCAEFISQIGDVTLEDEQTIAEAQAMYNRLPEEAKAYVNNYADIEKAGQKINEIKNDIKVNNCIEIISQIGEVTTSSADKIKAAEDCYNALSKENKDKVTNAAAITAAKEKLKALKQAEINSLLSKFKCEEDKVRNMKFYYPRTMEHYSDDCWAADIRCFVLPYIGMSNSSAELRLIHNYTDDDWVFFEKITYAVDDKRYYNSFNYGDVVRDNDGGEVWEYVDTYASESDIKMLWEIVNSNETIVRFEGDDYIHDFVINAEDKAAIKEILTAYELLTQK